MARKSLELSDTPMDIILKMSERNPGGLNVVMSILDLPPEDVDHFMGPMGLLLDLDDMNIRGSQIWLAYKDHCKEDLPTLVKAIRDRDPQMVKTINDLSSGEEVAVTAGGSYR